MPQVWCSPALTDTNAVTPETATGILLNATDALPSCPTLPAPQHQPSPAAVRPHAWSPPALTEANINALETRTTPDARDGTPLPS
ncbi:MAG: hypothetical protein NVS4B3_19130 [Gemmatimonadaceae bacterium]